MPVWTQHSQNWSSLVGFCSHTLRLLQAACSRGNIEITGWARGRSPETVPKINPSCISCCDLLPFNSSLSPTTLGELSGLSLHPDVYIFPLRPLPPSPVIRLMNLVRQTLYLCPPPPPFSIIHGLFLALLCAGLGWGVGLVGGWGVGGWAMVGCTFSSQLKYSCVCACVSVSERLHVCPSSLGGCACASIHVRCMKPEPLVQSSACWHVYFPPPPHECACAAFFSFISFLFFSFFFCLYFFDARWCVKPCRLIQLPK